MPKTYKNIAFFIIALFTGVVYFMATSRNTDIINSQPAHTLDADMLNTILKNDSIILNPEDVLEFKGVIKEINYLNNRTNILLNLDSKSKMFVICDMQDHLIEKKAALKVKDTIKVKGIYKGILKDVILLNCVISL